MMKINLEQIKEKIGELSIDQVAKTTGFEKRSPKKMSAKEFVLSFFKLIEDGGSALEDWAESFEELSGQSISAQGLNRKLQFRQEAFSHALLQKGLKLIAGWQGAHQQVVLFGAFENVYVEDSSCVSLPINTADFFPGPHSTKQAKIATARIQLRLNLLKEQYEHLAVCSYRHNDQSFAYDIIDHLQAKDLVIRDLGYHVLGAFEDIVEKGAYFLSRYKSGVHIRTCQQAEAVNLLALLKKEQRNGNSVLDRQVYLGEDKIAARLVAIKVPQNVAQARRRKAAQHRGSKTKHSKEYFELLGWVIYITNVPKEVWSYQDIMQAYGCRWRIEIVFKCWKTHFNFERFFSNKQSLHPARVSITIHLLLLWLTLFFARWYAYFAHQVYQLKRQHLSVQKFAKLLKKRFHRFLCEPNLDELIDKVAYYCRYNKRRRARNYLDSLYYENLC